MFEITAQSVKSIPTANTLTSATDSGAVAHEPASESSSFDSPIARVAAGLALAGIGIVTIAVAMLAIRWLAFKLAGLSVYELTQCV